MNTREVWIILAVNPDGAEYDISGGKFHFWRKNRQPNAGTTAIGTDLNRNFGYRWGGGGRTSTNPLAITYRGPFAFSAPETRNVRDFLASRVVNGRQQIRTAITFHETGRLVMWPYGYTYADVPVDMTLDDHNALAIIGKHMAATNGYKPEQASDLYITSGTTRDYEYGMYRIFSYTFELSVKDYPDDSLIASETGRNKEAVLYLIERASCPLAVLGMPTRIARCGAFDDDLEVGRGWQVNADGTDTATAGAWQRGDPQPTTTAAGRKQPDGVTSGRYAFVTGAAAGSSPSANDLDGGRTTATSPTIDLPATADQKLQFRWSFATDATAGAGDEFRVEVLDGATATTVLVTKGTGRDRNASWHLASLDLTALGRPGDQAPVLGHRQRNERHRRGALRRRPGDPAAVGPHPERAVPAAAGRCRPLPAGSGGGTSALPGSGLARILPSRPTGRTARSGGRHGTPRRQDGADLRRGERPLDRLGDRPGAPRRGRRGRLLVDRVADREARPAAGRLDRLDVRGAVRRPERRRHRARLRPLGPGPRRPRHPRPRPRLRQARGPDRPLHRHLARRLRPGP